MLIFTLMINCHFIKIESVNPYNTRAGKLLFIPHINATHFGIKSLRYNGPLARYNFCQSMNNNNVFNEGISKFKKISERFAVGKLLVISLYCK